MSGVNVLSKEEIDALLKEVRTGSPREDDYQKTPQDTLQPHEKTKQMGEAFKKRVEAYSQTVMTNFAEKLGRILAFKPDIHLKRHYLGTQKNLKEQGSEPHLHAFLESSEPNKGILIIFKRRFLAQLEEGYLGGDGKYQKLTNEKNNLSVGKQIIGKKMMDLLTNDFIEEMAEQANCLLTPSSEEHSQRCLNQLKGDVLIQEYTVTGAAMSGGLMIFMHRNLLGSVDKSAKTLRSGEV
jgi:flagellar motor switch protein FliM